MMKRSILIKQRLAFGIWFLPAMILVTCGPVEKNHAPCRNVVVIVSDDHSFKVTGCYGNEYVRTPNIDRIASEGIRFQNAYANAPICSASRQSLLTGKYPHATGVNLLFTPFNDDLNYTIAEHLQKNGFATGLVGKTHWNDWVYADYWETWPDYGFDTVITAADWQLFLRNHPAEKIPDGIATRTNTVHVNDIQWQKNAAMLPDPYFDRDSDGTFLAQRAIDFIRSHKRERFFLWVAFHQPHAPFGFPVEYANSYHPDSLPLARAGVEDQRWIPSIFRDLSEEERRGIVASYYTSVTYMDKNVGLILDALRNEEVEDETLVVYLGDQGYLLNEHGRYEKHTMWAESIRAPLVMKGGPITKGKVVNGVVEFVDLVPTLLDATGIGYPEGLQGESLWPVMQGSGSTHKEVVFAEYLEDNMAMVASEQWKYIFTTGKRDLGLGYETGYGPAGVTHLLYDLVNDPGETRNLAGDPAFAPLLDSLQGIMLSRFMHTHPQAGTVPSGLNTVGKLIWFCEPRDVGDEPGSELQRIFKNETMDK